jgi:hypothetical protein
MAKDLKKVAITFSFIFFSLVVFSQKSIRFRVNAGDYSREHCPVFVDLSRTNLLADNSNLCLYRNINSTLRRVIFQPDKTKGGLWFIPQGSFPENTTRNYILKSCSKKEIQISSLMKITQTGESLTLSRDDKLILKYHTATVMPPEGVDTAYQRSGFIHPLWSPDGEVLTRIQPPDHYHHYGIWAPWTKTHIGNREVDFWNLAKKLGTVRFTGISGIIEGALFCEFKVKQEHIDFGSDADEQVAINEELSVRAWNIGDGAWMIDYTSEQSTPLDSGILLDAYRYGGGLGFRATEKWTKNNCSVLTSEGKTRKDADGTKARWCRVEGESTTGRSGVVFMDNPQNREFPEPMRVWPLNTNKNRGDMFFDYCPIRHKSWRFEKGETCRLKYRLYVFDGSINNNKAEVLWQAFGNPPEVVFEE